VRTSERGSERVREAGSVAKMTEAEYVAFIEAERAAGADLGPYSVVPCDCERPSCLGWQMVLENHPFRAP